VALAEGISPLVGEETTLSQEKITIFIKCNSSNFKLTNIVQVFIKDATLYIHFLTSDDLLSRIKSLSFAGCLKLDMKNINLYRSNEKTKIIVKTNPSFREERVRIENVRAFSVYINTSNLVLKNVSGKKLFLYWLNSLSTRMVLFHKWVFYWPPHLFFPDLNKFNIGYRSQLNLSDASCKN
jgi:hypothetical protein